MPEELREPLARPYTVFDIAVVEGDRLAVASRLRAMLGLELHRVVCVGDYVCETFLKYVGVPRMCIVDGRTLREERIEISFEHMFKYVERCTNPRSHISRSCVKIVELSGDRHGLLIVVDGEEDLIALATSAMFEGMYLVFGLPRTGVAVMYVDRSNLVKALNMLSKFYPVDRDA